MTPAVTIGVISQILALCGIVSIRMFLPIFLYFLTMRLALVWPDYAPELIRQMAAHTPAWQVSYAFLTVFGLLAAAELAAVRNPDVKAFLDEDFDRYAKPIISILMACGVATTAQTLEVQELIDGATEVHTAAFGGFTLAMMIVAGCVTGFCCRVRSAVLEKIHAIDPENDLGLQRISNYLGEVALLIIFLALIFLPLLALILTGLGVLAGMFFQRLWVWYERHHSHLCAACAAAGKKTTVSDCALICPECGAEQPDVRRVALFGFSGRRPLAGLSPDRHAFRLLAAHRCRWCASPLDHSHRCRRCGRGQWTADLIRFYVKQTDLRGGVLLLVGLLSFAFPLGGLLLVLFLFRPLVVRPLSVHLGAGTRFLVAFLVMLLKVLLLLPILLLAMVPGAGLLVLVPFVGRYLYVRQQFMKRTVPVAAKA